MNSDWHQKNSLDYQRVANYDKFFHFPFFHSHFGANERN